VEKYAWHAVVKEGCMEEYIRRHAALWPEMKAALKAAGICNYTIWAMGNQLFGYYECEKGIAYAIRAQHDSPVVQKWEQHMTDIMIMERDPITGAQPELKKVFELD